MIDPTCDSGRFILETFHRYFRHWQDCEPGTNPRLLAQRALEAVHGVDLNPFAVVIARYGLLVAALAACGIPRLKDAPGFCIHVASGDSLLHGRRHDRFGQMVIYQEDWLPEPYAVGDFREATCILEHQYHAVVGNPPYITDKDECHREVVRKAYTSCYRQFAPGVPFTERFFDLASPETATTRAGYAGLITTNSFMKREFGKVLTEKVILELDLTHVLDTSGANIPGYGTPTVILFGRNRHSSSNTVRAALGSRGEPGTPDDLAQGVVWHSILRMLETPDQQNGFIMVADVERGKLHRHPWSLGDGDTSELKGAIEAECPQVLQALFEPPTGRAVRIAEENVFMFDNVRKRHSRASNHAFRYLVIGKVVRDWTSVPAIGVWYPYAQDNDEMTILPQLWRWRTTLAQLSTFQGNMADAGLRWFDYMRHAAPAYRPPLSITFAFVSTHNHFVLDRGGNVFKQTAPLIKLPPGSTEDGHLTLLGFLNSSSACFLMKQACFNKGATAKDGVLQEDPERFRFAFEGTKLQQFPIPALDTSRRNALLRVTSLLDQAGALLGGFSFKEELTHLLSAGTPALASALTEVMAGHARLRARMVRWQEELDWLCYELYGLLPHGSATRSLVHSSDLAEVDGLDEVARPYRSKAADSYQAPDTLLLARWNAIRSDATLNLLESPEYKQRWFRSAGAYDANNLDNSLLLQRATREWLLDRLETPGYWPDPTLTTCAQLAVSEAVPYLPSLRYMAPDLEKRKQWEETRALQRREDAGEKLSSHIPVPPRYSGTDFQKSDYWRLWGKLDVPKEHFILYPGAERESDPTPVLGWAGWDHLQQAQALATYYLHANDEEGWPPDRLRSLLEGLADLVSCLLLCHNDIDPATRERFGTFYQGFVDEQSRLLALEATPT